MIQHIYEHYHMHIKELIPLGPYKSFWIRNKIYVLVPIGEMEEEVLVEMKKLSDYMNLTRGYNCFDFRSDYTRLLCK